MELTAQVATRDKHGLADSSINYTVVAYQTCGARMCHQHSFLRTSHSCECTECNMPGLRDTCALSIVDVTNLHVYWGVVKAGSRREFPGVTAAAGAQWYLERPEVLVACRCEQMHSIHRLNTIHASHTKTEARFPFKRNRLRCVRCVKEKTVRNASACVSCGFRLRNARNASDSQQWLKLHRQKNIGN